MAERTPLWIHDKANTAKDDRGLLDALWTEGIINVGDLKVSQRAAGANKSVDVAAGFCVVQGDDTTGQGKYLFYNDAVENVVVPDNASGNPRIDRIVARIYDKVEVPGHAISKAEAELVQGTPAGSPVAPAVPLSAVPLATVAVANGFVSILDANITDGRVLAASKTRGTIPVLTALPATPADGDEIYYLADAANRVLWHLRYNAAGGTYKWEAVGAPGALYAEVLTRESTASTTYVALTTPGPTITLPLAGDYQVTQGAFSEGSGSARANMSYDIGATAALDVDSMTNLSSSTVSRMRKKAALGAVALTSKYRVTGAFTGWFEHRWIAATPVRVG